MQFFISFRTLIKRITVIRFMMADKAVPKRKKLLVVLGIIYLFLPIDLIPPVLFPIAWVDDLILWVWILWHLRDTLDQYWMGEKEINLKENFRGKNVVDDVDFTVDDDDN